APHPLADRLQHQPGESRGGAQGVQRPARSQVGRQDRQGDSRPFGHAPPRAAGVGVTGPKAGGEPIEEIYAVEGTPLITGPSAVMARAANPNAARLVYAWAMTAGAQQLNVEVGALRSVHPLVKDRPERKKLSDIKTLREDAAAVADQADDIKARYLKLFKV